MALNRTPNGRALAVLDLASLGTSGTSSSDEVSQRNHSQPKHSLSQMEVARYFYES